MTVSAPPTATTFPCVRCGNVLIHGQLACPNCGALVYVQQLNQLAAEAMQLEPTNPISAAMAWQRCLPLLPPGSEQYRMIVQRIGALTANFGVGPYAAPGAATADPGNGYGATAPRPPARDDPWPLAITKTAGSMLLSIIVYTWLFSSTQGLEFGLKFATGFVLLILIHELGHSFAMRYYGLSASPPIFIPFLGAVINLRQPPRNALEEAIVGIGGPVLGTVGAGITYMIYLKTGAPLFLLLAHFGFMLNLFNMLPVPPLDGGRVTAAVSPKVWVPGLLAVVAWIVRDFMRSGQINPILILLLLMAWPRVLGVLRGRALRQPYYDIGRAAKLVMGTAYVLLGLLLLVMFEVCKREVYYRIGSGWFG